MTDNIDPGANKTYASRVEKNLFPRDSSVLILLEWSKTIIRDYLAFYQLKRLIGESYSLFL
jgi:hypothetical protein